MSRRDEVLHAALDLLDEVGLDALTTRRLAHRLGVQPGALYRHFDSKRTLLAALVDHLVTSSNDPGALAPTAGDWAAQLRAAATGYRAALLTRRDGARLVATHLRPTQATARQTWNRLLGIMRDAGLPAEDAELAVDTVFAYVNGFAIEEQSRDGFPQPAARRAWRDDGFQAGLDLILTGIRHRLTPSGGRPSRVDLR
ncbi:TetR/AcrR family transcriptional regulator C-terminal domain-containing protein [Pseudonocardia acaciae]|uniref:TetR/AcrR family transcriptional regulator C-terminal domain-containing protein n=1 Tax=Pseudonocardia acaciae TaxID=551276 RepID=UPI0006872F6F|nr:TetR/AcrR family transcriptional regulator C-terminal domain-containing protein [Pseudonocardia acaciae]